MLVQFARLNPQSRKGRIYLFPTAEQAKSLFGVQGPFSFEGTFKPSEGVTEHRKASRIWLKSGSQIRHYEATYWSQCSGRMDELETRQTFDSDSLDYGAEKAPFAWFIASKCFLLEMIANLEPDEKERATKFGYDREDFSVILSDGATANVHRFTRFYQPGMLRGSRKMSYSIQVRGFGDSLQAKSDLDALLILCSLASRQRSLSSFWSHNERPHERVEHWRFNFGKIRGRSRAGEPLIIRSRDACQRFIQKAFEAYNRSQHKREIDLAVYALLAAELPTEIRIVRLFAGLQGAMMFALEVPRRAKRPRIDALNRKISQRWPAAFEDLWPLLDPRTGPSIGQIRHAIAHGEAFSEADRLALSYAEENLQWHLERLLLLALGWDLQESTVSPGFLRHFYAYDWRTEQKKIRM